MPLPELIEIRPTGRLVRAQIIVPGSKSITNRALALAALGKGTTILRGALWSQDTQVMVDALRALGIDVGIAQEATATSNRTITVRGCGGDFPADRLRKECIDLYVGNSGTAARFLAALVCLGRGRYRLHGTERMHERPQGGLFRALRSLGYTVDSANDRLPAVVNGGGPRPGHCQVSIEESSQYASALLLASVTGGWNVEIVGESGAEEAAYVEMTRRLLASFPRSGGELTIEPDASGGSCFWAAGWLLAVANSFRPEANTIKRAAVAMTADTARMVTVKDWPTSGWQIDARFPMCLPLPRRLSRATDLGDGIMTAIVLAADKDSGGVWKPDSDRPGWLVAETGCREPVRFSDLARLRVQECDRVAALRRELTKCGGVVAETGDTLEIHPAALRGAEIETYDDHRIAMCFAILGLKVHGMKIKNPACVRKTFPDFFVKIAQPAPAGLGVVVLDARTGRRLELDDLLAD